MLEFIRSNLAIYPKDFFKKIGLRKMAVYGTTTESTASFFIVGHFLEKRIRFFAHVPGDKDGFRQSVIHHEIAHAVTVNDVTFDEWVAKTHRCTIQEYASISKKPLALGFITPYARKNYIEDMAEVGMWMFDNPKFVATVEQQPDSIFVRKVLLLKARYRVAHEKINN
jgi:hypothetical protein